MSDLVTRLSEGSHPVELALRPDRNAESLRKSLERGYIHVKFTNTHGGTELGMPIAHETARLALAGINDGASTIIVSGHLWLDYKYVRCVAKINLDTFEGTGHLELLQVTSNARGLAASPLVVDQ